MYPLHWVSIMNQTQLIKSTMDAILPNISKGALIVMNQQHIQDTKKLIKERIEKEGI